jgi:hypothetical protein
MKLYNKKTNKLVRKGDVVTSFRGDHATVTGWTEPHKAGSSGRMAVEYLSGGGGEYYPSVFGCEFQEG